MLDLKALAGAIGEPAVLPTVGHELRTPLTSIRGYLETVLEGDLDARTARRFLETARREAEHLGRLIDRLAQSGESQWAPEPPSRGCDAVEQVRRAVEIVAPLARRRAVTLRTACPRRARVRAGAEECIHALTNLIENAIKHGSANGTVAVACRKLTGWVEIAIDDDGGGIAAAERETVFATGVRATTANAGCGIGLAVVRAIAQSAGGGVRLEASPLGGARFVLAFLAG